MFKTVWSGRGRVEMNISATFSSFYSKKKKMWLRFLILVAPSYSDPFISFATDGKGVPCLGLTLSLHFYHWGWKGTGELLLNDMCHPLCFFFFVSFSSIALSHHPSHILCGKVVFLLFVLFAVLVWNSLRFETFNEKIIQLEKKPSCVQWSNYSRRIFIFLKRFRLHLHGLLF